MATDWNDWADLLKSGFSLFGNILLASQQHQAGNSRGLGGFGGKAVGDLIDVGQKLSKIVEKSMAQQSTAIAFPRNVLNLNGKWDSENNKYQTPIDIRHAATGAICIYYPNDRGGYNEYFGAVNAGNIFISGHNSVGQYLIFKGVVNNSAIDVDVFEQGTNNFGREYIHRL